MNPRIEKIKDEIKRIKAKMIKGQTRLRELEKQLTDLENADILATVRGVEIAPNELAAFVQMLREKQQGGTVPDLDIAADGKVGISGATSPDGTADPNTQNEKEDTV